MSSFLTAKKEASLFIALCLSLLLLGSGLYHFPFLKDFTCSACLTPLAWTLPFWIFLFLGLALSLTMGKPLPFFFIFWTLLLLSPGAVFGRFETNYGVFAILLPLFGLLVLWRLAFSKSLYILATLILSLASCLFMLARSYLFMTSAKLIGSEQVLALVQTNFLEATGYLGKHPALSLPFVFSLFLFWRLLPLRRLLADRQEELLCELAPLGAILVGLLFFANPVLMEMKVAFGGALNYDSRAFAYREAAAERAKNLASLRVEREKNAPQGPLVIVIGESANKNHWGLYGYRRETTPGLERMGDSGLVAFDRVVACVASTILSLSGILTTASVESGKNYYDEGIFSLIEILKAAGFRTVWVSNQAEHGLWGQTVSDLVANADVIWFSEQDARRAETDSLLDTTLSFERRPWDDVLWPKIDEILENPKRPTVLFVHLMGSHVPYERRYPSTFGQFSAAKEGLPPLKNGVLWDEIDAYDNSILYTDAFLTRLIEKLKARNAESGLLYFSDHGESVFFGTEHDPEQMTAGHLEVPFILWLSEKYRAKRPHIALQARNHRHKPFALDQTSQVILDLAGVKGPFYLPKRSPLNPAFSPSPRRLVKQRGGGSIESLLKESYYDLVRKETGHDPEKINKPQP